MSIDPTKLACDQYSLVLLKLMETSLPCLAWSGETSCHYDNHSYRKYQIFLVEVEPASLPCTHQRNHNEAARAPH